MSAPCKGHDEWPGADGLAVESDRFEEIEIVGWVETGNRVGSTTQIPLLQPIVPSRGNGQGVEY